MLFKMSTFCPILEPCGMQILHFLGKSLPTGQMLLKLLTITPQAQMDSESIAHEAKGLIGY